MSKKLEPIAVNGDWEEPTAENAGVIVTPPKNDRHSHILQPVAFAPYAASADKASAWQMTPSGYDINQARRDIAASYEKDVPVEAEDTALEEAALAPEKKRVRFVPIFIAVLSLLVIAVLVLGKFVLEKELALVAGISGYGYIEKLVELISDIAGGAAFSIDLLVPCAVAVVALFSVINVIASLVKITSRGACVLSKISIFFMLLASLVIILVSVLDVQELGYGIYAVGGLSFIMLFVGYLAKNDVKSK